MPALKSGEYVPLAARVHVARAAWEPLPESALALEPIVLFRGDVLRVDGVMARYWSFNINSVRLELQPLVAGDDISRFPTLGKWDSDTTVELVEEDCLGHCYRGQRALENQG